MHERLRTGSYEHAVRLEGAQVRGRDVLVVEGDDGSPRADAAQRPQVVVPTDPYVAHDLCRALVGTRREHPQPDAEGDRRLLHHPRQLPTTDHRHDREPGSDEVGRLAVLGHER